MKSYFWNLLPFILGLGCIIAYRLIGYKVAEDGTLIEPLFLIPSAFILFFIGILALCIRFIYACIKNK